MIVSEQITTMSLWLIDPNFVNDKIQVLVWLYDVTDSGEESVETVL